MSENKQIKVTLKRSTIGCLENQKAVIKALGLKKINQFKVHSDTPTIRGMIAKVSHLVEVESL